MLNYPFAVDVTIAATTGTSQVTPLTNKIRVALDVAEPGASSVIDKPTLPSTGFWVTGLSITTSSPCILELGYVKDATFYPIYKTHATKATGSGMSRVMKNGLHFPVDGVTRILAIRLTDAGATTPIEVAGDLELYARP
jgi:hypothetical protein